MFADDTSKLITNSLDKIIIDTSNRLSTNEYQLDSAGIKSNYDFSPTVRKLLATIIDDNLF